MAQKARNNFNPGWLPDYAKAFGNPGLSVLAFWLGSLFAQKIRDKQRTFPILELTGCPASGKSTVTEFCWKLVGKQDYEGFAFGLSSHAAIRRVLNAANMPVVSIETDLGSPFNFEQYKSLYNGRTPFVCAKADSSGELEDQQFRGTLMIQQVEKVNGSPALQSRMVNVHMDKLHHNQDTFETARWCERQTVNDLGGFLPLSLLNEKQILKTYFTAFANLEAAFTARGARNGRVIKNHTQIAALVQALPVIFPNFTDDILPDFTNYMINRTIICEARISEGS